MPVPSLAPPASSVRLIPWPADRTARVRAALNHQPRLLVLVDGSAPPAAADPLEDWTFTSAPPADIALRVRTLGERAERREQRRCHVELAGVSLPTIVVLEVLAAPVGQPVSRTTLRRALAAAGCAASPTALGRTINTARTALMSTSLELLTLGHGELVLTTRSDGAR